MEGGAALPGPPRLLGEEDLKKQEKEAKKEMKKKEKEMKAMGMEDESENDGSSSEEEEEAMIDQKVSGWAARAAQWLCKT